MGRKEGIMNRNIEQIAQEYERQYLGELSDRELWETADQILKWAELEEDNPKEDKIPDEILEWAREYKTNASMKKRRNSMKKIAEYDRLTVGQLRELINGMDDNIKVSIMGVTYGIKVYTDNTHIILDSEELSEEEEE